MKNNCLIVLYIVFFSCFFCQSKCCKNIDDGNPWTSPHESENCSDSEFQKELGKYTTSARNIKKNIKNKTAENIVINIDNQTGKINYYAYFTHI